MTKALRYDGLTPDEVTEGNAALLDVLSSGKPGSFRLKLANSLWLRQGPAFSADYLKKLQYMYRAGVAALDFSSKGAPDTINRWVREHTDGRIAKMVDQPFSDQDMLVLLNAASFEAKWESPFKAETTHDGDFTRADGSKVTVPLMRQLTSFGYQKADRYQVVRLPYADSSFSMVVVLPDEKTKLAELLPELLAHTEDWADSAFAKRQVDLTLPKFRFSDETELMEPLTALGMKRAFLPGEADFGPIGDIQPPLAISRILQRSFIEVDEEGTKAAAATSIGMAGSAPPSEQVRMVVDRPFFFAIQDTETGTLLFTGTVYDPEVGK